MNNNTTTTPADNSTTPVDNTTTPVDNTETSVPDNTTNLVDNKTTTPVPNNPKIPADNFTANNETYNDTSTY